MQIIRREGLVACYSADITGREKHIFRPVLREIIKDRLPIHQVQPPMANGNHIFIMPLSEFPQQDIAK